MPGRQRTFAPSTEKTKSRKQKAKRSLNALAIAEKQIPTRTKIRKSRLGQIEPEPESAKRKRQDSDDGSALEEDSAMSKRRRAGAKDRYGNEVEIGNDSSGNEWVTGQVNSDEDSDLDSDEAMGANDEEKYNRFIFGGSSTVKKNGVKNSNITDEAAEDDELHDTDLREDENYSMVSEDDSDDLGDEAVDLATALDVSDEYDDDRPQEPRMSGHSVMARAGTKSEGREMDGDMPAVEEESVLSLTEDEEDAKDSAKLASLKALVSTMNEQEHDGAHTKAAKNTQEWITPSEFGLTSERKLTIADMIPSVTDPQFRKSLKLLANNDSTSSGKRGGIPKKLDVPIPKRQQDRLDRAAAYEKSKETLNRWIETVKHNRRAEHLSFPLKNPNAVVAPGTLRFRPDSHSHPMTELESTIRTILLESGLAEPNGKHEEGQLQAFEEMQTNKMPFEEVQARRANLRRARELLFREETRAKRIKKIKSKSYRKVHRKDRERAAQQEKDAFAAAGVDDSESERERNDRRRAEERMGARHRESKWAKGVKDSGRAKWDEDARGGVTEMAKRSDDLRRRIEGKRVNDENDNITSSDSDSDNDADDEVVDVHGERRAIKVQDQLHRLTKEDSDSVPQNKLSRLASMDFMKKAEAARKGRNDAEVESLRRELAGGQTSSEEEPTEGIGRKLFGPAKGANTPSTMLMQEDKGELEERQGSDGENNDDHVRNMEEELEILVDNSGIHGKVGPERQFSLAGKQKGPSQATGKSMRAVSENLWLTTGKKGSSEGKRQTKVPPAGVIVSNSIAKDTIAASEPKVKLRSALKGAREAEVVRRTEQLTTSDAVAGASDTGDEEHDAEKLPFVLRDQELVRRAFGGDEVAADFEKEKRDITYEEQEKIVDDTLPGWGNWTGEGIGKKQQKRNKGRFLRKEAGVAKEKRQDAKLDRVVINEKRIKKNAKYLASSLPHPFETRQQYERSLRLPVGPEWSTKQTFQSATKPRVLMKQGIIAPIARPLI